MKIKIFILFIASLCLISCMSVKKNTQMEKESMVSLNVDSELNADSLTEPEAASAAISVFLCLILSVGLINSLLLIFPKKSKQTQKKL